MISIKPRSVNKRLDEISSQLGYHILDRAIARQKKGTFATY
jgi:hypothetical protein